MSVYSCCPNLQICPSLKLLAGNHMKGFCSCWKGWPCALNSCRWLCLVSNNYASGEVTAHGLLTRSPSTAPIPAFSHLGIVGFVTLRASPLQDGQEVTQSRAFIKCPQTSNNPVQVLRRCTNGEVSGWWCGQQPSSEDTYRHQKDMWKHCQGGWNPFFLGSGAAPCKGAPGWLGLLAPSALPAPGTREIQASTSRLIK